LTAHTWNAFVGLVERHNGIFGGCWCIYFHPDCAERGQSYEGNRALKKRLVEAGQAHAALVMVGDEAIAWAEYGTPDELPTIHHRKQYFAEADVMPDYRITCIFVDKRHRGLGYAKVALAGALDLIAAQGGGVVEGYPHEIGEKRMNNSAVYNGTRTMYEQAGFEFVRSKGDGEHRHEPHDPTGLSLPNRRGFVTQIAQSWADEGHALAAEIRRALPSGVALKVDLWPVRSPTLREQLRRWLDRRASDNRGQ
jgi:GNAT superfamily N-acetyltransferase